jgi:hypothetical protein
VQPVIRPGSLHQTDDQAEATATKHRASVVLFHALIAAAAMNPGVVASTRRATRIPNWVWALGFGSISVGTYWYVVQKVGANDLNQALEDESARQAAAGQRK